MLNLERSGRSYGRSGGSGEGRGGGAAAAQPRPPRPLPQKLTPLAAHSIKIKVFPCFLMFWNSNVFVAHFHVFSNVFGCFQRNIMIPASTPNIEIWPQ